MGIFKSPWTHLLLVLVTIFALVVATSAMKHTLRIKRDHRTHFLIEKFAFQPNGVLQLNITEIEPSVGATKNIRAMGIFITISKAEFINLSFPANKCPLLIDATSPNARLATQLGGVVETQTTKGGISYQVIAYESHSSTLTISQNVTEDTAGLWTVYWVVCASEVPTYSFNLKLDQWNTLSSGRRSYLPVGEIPLPYVYGAFDVICLLMFAFWIAYFLCAKDRKVNAVHWMMTVLIFFKVLTLFCQAFMYGTMARTGDAQGWNIAYYVFQSIRAVALFTVVLMIGTGFSFLKPYLSDSDKRLFFIVLPLQVVANVALIITEETMPGTANWSFWLYFFRAVDIICCACVLIPIVSSMNHLKNAAQSDGKARKSLEKLILFRRFYLIVICYIYFTRIVVLLLSSTLPYQRAWVGPFVAELSAVVFYCITGYQFRPIRDNPYFSVDQEESDQLELRAIEAIQNEDL